MQYTYKASPEMLKKRMKTHAEHFAHRFHKPSDQMVSELEAVDIEKSLPAWLDQHMEYALKNFVFDMLQARIDDKN